jgi:transcriptional regulator with XRE-family HTH domain
MITRLGQLVRQIREAAGLSLAQLASLTGLSIPRLEELERGGGEPASFDLCYKLGEALSARTGRRFILHDLWLACSVDKYFHNQSRHDLPVDSDQAA